MSEFLRSLLENDFFTKPLAGEENKVTPEDIHNQLDNKAEKDEVDTITFGLEASDGSIVKVYVNAEQAEDFEGALAKAIGESDDIEAVLDELSADFDIIDVEWPNKEEDAENKDSSEEDGSESLNDKIDYDDGKDTDVDVKKQKATGKYESLGQKFMKKILEASWTEAPDEDAEVADKDADVIAADAAEKEKKKDSTLSTGSASDWEVEKDDENGLTLTTKDFEMSLDRDETMDLINKLGEKSVARFKDETGKVSYVFSPRGSDYILKTPEHPGGFKIAKSIVDKILD